MAIFSSPLLLDRSNATAQCSRVMLYLASLVFFLAGCNDDTALVRNIQTQRQERLQADTKHDHLGEFHSLLTRFIELNPEESRRQITYHLNQWLDTNPLPTDSAAPKLLESLSGLMPLDQSKALVLEDHFERSDVNHLRDAYLFHSIFQWIDSPARDDILLTDWLKSLKKSIGEEHATRLTTACRLFDWTVRNVALERWEAPPALQITPPELPLGLAFQGPGYRQTDYESVWRGTGDSLQRAGVFMQLCHQADLPSALLAIPSTEDGSLAPWAVGVLIGEEVYLFEPALGTFIPGPNQVGISTLAEARTDASVMRRLNIPGLYDYPFAKPDIQQNVALLNTMPVGISVRMKHLQSKLTGDARMRIFMDADNTAEIFDNVGGIAGVQIWEVPMLSEVYHASIEQAAQRDPLLGFWYFSRWAIMDGDVESSRSFSLARWRHLHGQLDTDEDSNIQGARSLYLNQRRPEFEIADLRTDVDLQKAYGIRRELGMDPAIYDRQVQQAQMMIRQGKQTATYWLSLIQYDDERYDTAETWFRKRVLEDSSQKSTWEPSARYNLARTIEHLGQEDKAVELYKTNGDIQEHGNRIRARLLSKANSEE